MTGAPVDRVPISFWLHFPDVDLDGPALAERLIQFNAEYDLDFIKVMPSGLYSVMDWGGTIRRFDNPYDVPEVVEFAVKTPDDWQKLVPLDINSGAWGEELKTLEALQSRVGGTVPYVETIFSPLTTALKLAGERLFSHLVEAPEAVHTGLDVITQTTLAFVEAACRRGISGVFFATQCASADRLTLEAHNEFGRRYDLQVLSRLDRSTYLNILHIHGHNTYFEDVFDYPVSAINWHDRQTFPSLTEARALTSKCLIGGINEEDVLGISARKVVNQVEEAIEETGGRGLILAPGCVLPTRAKSEILRSLREATH